MENIENPTQQRTKITNVLSSSEFLEPNHPLFWHGRLFDAADEPESDNISSSTLLVPPKVTWQSMHKPRQDHENAPNWLTATEYLDVDSVMNEKISRLAELLLVSKKTIVYSGAGISVAAGIGQASLGAKHKQQQQRMLSTFALPTTAHYALSALANHGFIHGWVQQNHDGLPQKAGFPQEQINEVHGSWYDPSNPVVIYSGSLRNREYSWMVRDAETADLALVVGTSLSGLNADQVATKPAHRSIGAGKGWSGGGSSSSSSSLGMVMINLQQTPQDGKASLRIFGASDDVLLALLSKMNIPMPSNPQPKTFPTGHNHRRFLVPYNQHGKLILPSKKTRTTKEKRMMMWLDLTVGAKIKVVNHNIKGAKQPSHRHIVDDQAVGEVIRWSDRAMAVQLNVKNCQMSLGYWWLEVARQGRTPTIPVVNVDPIMATN